jgi:hypothetical protein
MQGIRTTLCASIEPLRGPHHGRFFAAFLFLGGLLHPDAFEFSAAFFFLPGRFNAMNSPDVRSRLAQALAPPSVALVRERFFITPLRALSPTSLLTAMANFSQRLPRPWMSRKPGLIFEPRAPVEEPTKPLLRPPQMRIPWFERH